MSRIMKYTGGKAEVVYQNFDGGVQEMGSGADIVWERCGKCGEEYNEEYSHTCQPTALKKQVDGNHYKDLAIQPMEYSFKNKLDPAQHTVIKYITRFRNKNGRKDLEKAIHCIEMLIELEYGNE